MPTLAEALGDSSCGLDIRGYKLVPNDALLTRIAVYTPIIVEAILSDHSEIVDTWLSKLHEKYLTLKKSCEREEKTPAASLVTNESLNARFTCSICSSTFSDSEEYCRHRLREIETAKNRQNQPATAEMEFTREKDIPPNPIWWLGS